MEDAANKPQENAPRDLWAEKTAGGAQHSALEWFENATVGEDLRTRYTPQRRFASTFIAMAPWLDVLLLCTAFVLFSLATRLVPGQPAAIMEAPFRSGTLQDKGYPVVVNALHGASEDTAGGIAAVVFADEVRYVLTQENQVQLFRKSLIKYRSNSHRIYNEDVIMLYMDPDVPYSTILKIADLLRSSGFEKLHFVTKQK